ncbi:hypothetical protein [Arthrobacter sp. C9C5]|uniref:hypothetical protein n=1 Tax=Arthrobacter sp. C9C5 TaxID=2735267 RepID=UPI001584DF8A|nr:hypothetical protein [Arthrobacter sp. C9C5]NUU32430.1 hypothetical protein [Arthrobacter sp. C9C5]
MRRLAGTAIIGVLSGVLLCGCWLVPVTRTDVCVDWVRFETMQQRVEHASAVLVGKPVKGDGEVRSYGYQANVHTVEVEQVLKGGIGADPVRIASMPVTCGKSYPDGDPLDTGARQLFFLTEQNGEWFTMTPEQGAVPFPPGTPLPFKAG